MKTWILITLFGMSAGSLGIPELAGDSVSEQSRACDETEPIITESSLRVFQHEDGKTVQGRMVAYHPGKNRVIIAKESGGTFSIDLNQLSKTDQAYVHDWYLVKGFLSRDGFRISAKQRDRQGGAEYLIWRPGEIVVYDIILENRCDFDMENLNLDYNIYYSAKRSSIPDPNPDQGVKYGQMDIEQLAAGEKRKVESLSLSFPMEDLFEYYKEGEVPPVILQGIRLRVYLQLDSGRKAMREFSLPGDLKKQKTWSTSNVKIGMQRR